MKSNVTNDHHCIHVGESSAGPGLSYSWKDYIKYLGDGKWQLLSEFDDGENRIIEMTNKELVSWGMERYYESLDNDYESIIKSLKKVINNTDDDFCKIMIEWSVNSSSVSPQIIKIKSISSRDIQKTSPGKWGFTSIKTISKPGCIVETNHGDCFIWHPKGNKTTMFFTLDKSNEFSWEIELTDSQIEEIESLL